MVVLNLNGFAKIMKILIVRVSAIGDVVHTLPAFFLLKHSLPNAQISWVVQQKAASLLRDQPFLEKLWILPDHFLAPRNWKETERIAREIHATHWDAIIDFQGIFKTSVLMLGLKGTKYGFDYKNARWGMSSFLTHKHTAPLYDNIIQKNLALASSVITDLSGAQSCPTIDQLHKECSLAIKPEQQNIIEQWLSENDIKKYILLAPNTTWKSKHWPLEQWQKLLEIFSHKYQSTYRDYAIVLLGKDFGDQAELLAAFCKERNLNIVLAPKWDLITTSYLINKAQLIIAPDTGVLHIADFFGTQSIGIFGPTNAQKHGPFLMNQNKKNVIQIPCQHFYQKTHGPEQKDSNLTNCMYKLTPDQLLERVRANL